MSSQGEPIHIEGVIFDMDGVMLDTEPLYRAAWRKAASEFGHQLPDRLYLRLVGRNVEDAERALLDEFGSAFPLDAFRERYQGFEAEFRRNPLPKKPGLDELLDALDDWKIPKAVATSTRRDIALPELAATGLLERFSAIATGDEVTNGKPAPDLFLLAAQRLGVAPVACLVIEDAEPGIVGARRAGMQVYFVPDLQPPSPAVKRTTDGIFDSLFQVATHLASLQGRAGQVRTR